MKGTQKPRLPTIACPHCGGRAEVRTSEGISPIYRELRLRCRNDDCGHQYIASYSVLRTVVPSACPNPSIRLPISAVRKPQPANDIALPYVVDDEVTREVG